MYTYINKIIYKYIYIKYKYIFIYSFKNSYSGVVLIGS